jgi:tripartite-type tricarboxylate transporter receptor subunit TctC
VLIANGACFADAGGYPSKPVKLVVGFAAGGPTDVVARAFADHAGRALGQPFVVEDKPGANTILAAPADGHTLLFGATNHTMIPALYGARVKFDAVQSFQPLCTVATFAEAGGGNYAADAWYGVLAPAGLAQPIAQQLEKAARDFAASGAAAEKLRGLGLDANATCGPESAQQVEREVATYTQIARDLKAE